MPVAPHSPAGTMSPNAAAHVASRARKLLRARRLTPHDYAVLDALLWAARKPGTDTAVAAYSRLQRLAAVARSTVAKAVARLAELGLVNRLKRRVLVLWNNGGRQWRQLSNAYRFRCESAAHTRVPANRN